MAWAIARKLCRGHQDDAEDCVQEALMRLCKLKLTGVKNPDAYIRTALRNGAIDHIRTLPGRRARPLSRRALGLPTYKDLMEEGDEWWNPEHWPQLSRPRKVRYRYRGRYTNYHPTELTYQPGRSE